MGTGSSSDPDVRAEVADALHRLRSTLARIRAELELAQADGESPPVDLLLDDVRAALDMVADVEGVALGIVRVLVVDDDERLGELTARGLRRLGYDADASAGLRALRAREVVVFDLGVSRTLSSSDRAELRSTRPIVVTGAVDAASRELAKDLGASDYLVKPVAIEELAAAINRRTAEERQ